MTTGLSHYQRHLLTHFFDELEDKMATICEDLERIHVLKEKATEKKLERLFRKNLELYEHFEQFAKDKREFLKGEKIPYTFVASIIVYLTTRIKLTAQKHLKS